MSEQSVPAGHSRGMLSKLRANTAAMATFEAISIRLGALGLVAGPLRRLRDAGGGLHPFDVIIRCTGGRVGRLVFCSKYVAAGGPASPYGALHGSPGASGSDRDRRRGGGGDGGLAAASAALMLQGRLRASCSQACCSLALR